MDGRNSQGLCYPLVKRLDLMPLGKKRCCSGEDARTATGLEYVSPGEHHCAQAQCSLLLPSRVRDSDIRLAPPHPDFLINWPTHIPSRRPK